MINIDYDNLGPEYLIPVYFPTITKIKKETRIQEKFGGIKPFFKKGEKWPLDSSNKPMSFICQFKDP